MPGIYEIEEIAATLKKCGLVEKPGNKNVCFEFPIVYTKEGIPLGPHILIKHKKVSEVKPISTYEQAGGFIYSAIKFNSRVNPWRVYLKQSTQNNLLAYGCTGLRSDFPTVSQMFLHDDVLYIAEHVIEPMTDQHHGLKDVIERTHQTFTMTATQIIAPNGFSAVNWFHGVDDGKAQKESFEKARKQMKFAMSYLNHVIDCQEAVRFLDEDIQTFKAGGVKNPRTTIMDLFQTRFEEKS